MSDTPKVVAIKRDGWREAAAALRATADQLESGELPPCDIGVLVMMDKDGQVETFGIGPRGDDLQVIAMLRIGEQVVIQKALQGISF